VFSDYGNIVFTVYDGVIFTVGDGNAENNHGKSASTFIGLTDGNIIGAYSIIYGGTKIIIALSKNPELRHLKIP